MSQMIISSQGSEREADADFIWSDRAAGEL